MTRETIHTPQNDHSKAGFVALIGEPNAGKSTLLNRMVGAKVSIVTHKVQTTRSRIRGIVTHENSQIVFVDTPGLFRPRRRLDRAMVKAAWGGAGDADIIVLLIEAHRGITEGVKTILKQLSDMSHAAQNSAKKVALIINKIDRIKAEHLLSLAREMNNAFPFANTFMVSAERGYGVNDLRDWLCLELPQGPWLYPEDQIADLPMRMIAAEMTREKLTLRLHEELPYQLTVETESWETLKDGSIRIAQIIYIAREGHKAIILGHKGETIKKINQAARADISAFTEKKVHLFLTLKVRENWLEDAQRYSQMGLDFRDGDS